MEVFKFGGASVRDADSVRNLYGILNKYTDVSLVVVVSAMGKVTNLLEAVWQSENSNELETLLNKFRDFHLEIAKDLLTPDNAFFDWFSDLLNQLEFITKKNDHSDRYYSEIVAFGELVSTRLIQEYFNSADHQLIWLDARKLIKTDGHFTNAHLNWELTEKQMASAISFSPESFTVTLHRVLLQVIRMVLPLRLEERVRITAVAFSLQYSRLKYTLSGKTSPVY